MSVFRRLNDLERSLPGELVVVDLTPGGLTPEAKRQLVADAQRRAGPRSTVWALRWADDAPGPAGPVLRLQWGDDTDDGC